MSDWNRKVIDEFRANDGEVAAFEDRPLLLLHHRGAKTGTERVNPLARVDFDGGYAVMASKGGSPDNPDWYHNLRANPDAKVELGHETIPVRARVLEGAEKDRAWEKITSERPAFAEYQEKTERTIPVLLLEPR